MQFLMGTMNVYYRTPRARLGLADSESLFDVYKHPTAPRKRAICLCVAFVLTLST